jgi:hypothetical protein
MNSIPNPIGSDRIRPAQKSYGNPGCGPANGSDGQILFSYSSTNLHFIPIVQLGKNIRWDSIA